MYIYILLIIIIYLFIKYKINYKENFQIDELIYNNENIKSVIKPLIKNKITYSLGYSHGLDNIKIYNNEDNIDIILALDKYIYLNENIDNMIEKIIKSLNKGGYLLIDIFDKEILGIPREYTQYYLDKNNLKHTLTYFNNFVVDTYYNNEILNELIIYKNGEKKLNEYKLYLSNNIRNILKKNMKLIKILNYKDIDDRKLYIYEKIY